MPPITESPEWRALDAHFAELRDTHLRDVFAADPTRGERLTVEVDGVYLDYSKNRLTDETLRLLVALAERADLRDRIDAMFRGDKINVTEDRAVLHTALRAPEGAIVEVDGENVVPDVHAVLRKMADFAERVRSGQWTGHTGKRVRTVVNIGIGGSDLGPHMAYDALRDFPSETCSSASSAMSTAPTSGRRPTTSTPRRPSSSSRRRRSPRSRPSPTPAARATGAWPASVVTSLRWPSTSSRCRPTPPRSRDSASTPPTCSSSGTGSAVATRTTPPSASR